MMLKYAFFLLFCFISLMADEKPPLKYPCGLGEWGEFHQQSLNAKTPNEFLFMAVKNFEKEHHKPGFAVDLGAGTGKDTLYLLNKNWRVLAIDQEPESIKILLSRVPPDQRNRLEVKLSSFTDMKLPDNVDLITSNSLPFLKPEEFSKVWQNIVDHLAIGGRFSGHFFGDKDVYAIRALYPDMTTHSHAQVLELFKDRFQIESLEVEKIMHPTLDGSSEELWHAIYVVAKKIKN